MYTLLKDVIPGDIQSGKKNGKRRGEKPTREHNTENVTSWTLPITCFVGG